MQIGANNPALGHRMGKIIVRARPGVGISVRQIKHSFPFGAAISSRVFQTFSANDRQRYLDILKAHFNSAVHENALKWYATEKNRGEVTWKTADDILGWCETNGLTMRGHCVFWSKDMYVQPWIKDLDDASLRTAARERAHTLLRRYRGRIGEYDVNNEMLHGDFYERRLGPGIRREMFQWCRDADPGAILYVNDYDILNGKSLDAYESQIASLLEEGIPVGGIGVQGHFGPEGVDITKVRRSLGRLSRFGLPIKVTEFDINSNDEQVKERGLFDLYTAAFEHPAVTGILMWGFWEGAHWLPDAALWKKDWTPTPAVEAYRRLIFDRWWTRFDGIANESGECSVPAFFGVHRVAIAGGSTVEVRLSQEDGTVTVS